jgi:Uma2 family endonuclease
MVRPPTLPPLVRGQWLPMTYEEFLAWVPDGAQAEWVDGKGIIFVTTSARHAQLGLFLKRLVAAFLALFELGRVFDAPFEMRLRSGASRREPDILVVLNEHRDRVQRHWLDGPADLVIELVSEHSVALDRVDKRREYEAAGVTEYLIVDTREGEQGFEFYRLAEAGLYRPVAPDQQGRYHSQVLPGFWLDPTWLWQDPLPMPEELMLQIAPDAYRRYLRALLGEAGRGEAPAGASA